MQTAEVQIAPETLIGSPLPRIAPPTPARTALREFESAAASLGISLMPWQRVAAKYLTALGKADDWLYREICIVVARQNGKTELLKPRIVMALDAGAHVLHTAQDGSLPLETFEELADLLEDDPRVKRVKRANGKESIYFHSGGRYTVVAPTHGVRGRHADLVVIDEIREQHDERLMKAILPTIMARPKAQVIYLSNAGDPESVVLNGLRERREAIEHLAYLEWSAAPECDIDDRVGWAEANPALGTTITIERLADLRESLSPDAFETENLCRWVASMDERLISPGAWKAQAFGDLPVATLRRVMGVSLDQTAGRASAVVAWQDKDGTVCLDLVGDATGPVDQIGPAFQELAIHYRVAAIAYDPYSADLARHLRKAGRPTTGREFVVASGKFVELVEARRLRVRDDKAILSQDLAWTTRKNVGNGAYMAMRASEDHPITSVHAAVRAAWLASAPTLTTPSRGIQ